MKRAHILTGLLAVLAFSLTAQAASPLPLTGSMPTQNTDDTTIPATGPGSLVTLRIEWGTCSAPNVFGVKGGEWTQPAGAPGANFSRPFTVTTPGTYCARSYVSNTYGNESGASPVVTRVVDAPTPKPPLMAAVGIAFTSPAIQLDSLDGFKRTPVFSITASGPGVLLGFCKVGTPSTQDAVYTYKDQPYCRPLEAHPRTGAPNIAWLRDVTAAQKLNASVPCA